MTTISDADLAAMRERLNAATPGPWIHSPSEQCGPTPDWGVFQEESAGEICFVGDPYPRGENHPYENMVFIANAPTDMARLLDALDAERAARRAAVAAMWEDWPATFGLQQQRTAAIRALVRLDAAE